MPILLPDPPRRPRRFDLIAFDWDGTLYDSTQIIVRCIQAAVVDVGGARPSDTAAAYVIGMALMPALARAAPDVPPEKYQELANRYRFHFFKRQDDICVFDGILSLLADLRVRGHWLTVATGKSRMGLNHALQDSQFNGLFDGSRTADETAGKPSPLMLNELMTEFGVEPERTLMIGDTTHDLQMAVNAGCPCVGVSYGTHAPDSFAQFNPLFVADSAAQLREWLLANA